MHKWLLKLIMKKLGGRDCDLLVDIDYMERWYIIPRNRFFNIYFHKFIGSDANTPHDHPWFSFGWILSGEYIEHTPTHIYVRKEGSKTFRAPWSMHWIEIDKPVYTLFITGPRLRRWGFKCEQWVDSELYIKRRGSNRLASGCGERGSIKEDEIKEQALNEHPVSFIYGAYHMLGSGFVWRHNCNISMTFLEQLEHNKKIDPNFKVHLPNTSALPVN